MDVLTSVQRKSTDTSGSSTTARMPACAPLAASRNASFTCEWQKQLYVGAASGAGALSYNAAQVRFPRSTTEGEGTAVAESSTSTYGGLNTVLSVSEVGPRHESASSWRPL